MIKKINKFITIILLLFFIATPFAYGAENDPDPEVGTTFADFMNINFGSATTTNGGITVTQPMGDIVNGGFGIYIKLIMYNEETKAEEIVGVPILLYSGGLLDDIVEVNSSAGSSKESKSGPSPACYSTVAGACEAYADTHPGTVILDSKNGTKDFYSSYNKGGADKVRDISTPAGEISLGTTTLTQNGNEDGTKGWTRASDKCISEINQSYGPEVSSYYNKAEIRYLFDGKVSSKTESQIKALAHTGGIVKYKSTTELRNQTELYNYIKNFKNGVTVIKSSVDLGSQANLYTYINNYILGANRGSVNADSKLLRDNNGSGIVTLKTVLAAFNISHINTAKMRDYYLSFEPVTRERTDIVLRSYTHVQSTFNKYPAASWEWKCGHLTRCTVNATWITDTPDRPKDGSGGCYCKYKYNVWNSCKYERPTTTCKGYINSLGQCIGGYKKQCVGGYDEHDATENGTWDGGNCHTYERHVTTTIIKVSNYKISVIQPARYGGEKTSAVNSKISKLSNIITSDQPENKHCILNSANECTGNYEYFIGPTADTAIAVEAKLFGSKNKYNLALPTTPKTIAGANLTGTPKTTVGVGYWWLLDVTNCKKECKGTGDDLLSCAENYCDNAIGYDTRANVQKLKSGCIRNFCGYVYGKDPTGGNDQRKNESLNSCANSNPYNGIVDTTGRSTTGSTCSVDDANPANNYTSGTMVSCVGDKVTDFDNDDTNDTIFDQRTYINRACKETSKFNYTDTRDKPYVAGEGIDYYAKLKAERECTVYFNLEQWKFDYATIHSSDTLRRNRLKFIYETFNNQLKDDYDIKTNSKYNDAYDSGEGEVNWGELEFDDSKVTVKSKVNEIVKNTPTASSEETLVKVKGNKETSQNVTKNEKIKAFSNTKSEEYNVNRYVQKSNVNNYYGFKKYCVSTDGKATVYEAPENNICYVRRGHNACEV